MKKEEVSIGGGGGPIPEIGKIVANTEVEKPSPGQIEAYVKDTKGFHEVFFKGDTRFEFLKYILGEVPQLLIGYTNNVSAGIITLGIWLILLLAFGDIIALFGTFRPLVSWLIAFILTLIAANLKFVIYMVAFSLIVTSYVGAVSVFLSLILIFLFFFAFFLGMSPLRKMLVARKLAEMSMRVAIGSVKAAEGVKVATAMAGAAEEAGRRGHI